MIKQSTCIPWTAEISDAKLFINNQTCRLSHVASADQQEKP